MKKEKLRETKLFNIRLKRDLWLWLKNNVSEQDMSMQAALVGLIEKYKKEWEKNDKRS